MESLHLHEIGVILLSEIILTKKLSMKELIIKICVHLTMSVFLTEFLCTTANLLADGGTTSFGRFVPKDFVKVNAIDKINPTNRP